MATIKQMADKAKRVNAEALASAAIKKASIEHEQKILDLNRAQLNKSGIDSNSAKLPGYSNPYKKVRQKAGKQVRYKDLNFTGEWQSKLKLLAFNNFIEFSNTDRKDKFLSQNWGNAIKGLTKKNVEIASRLFYMPAYLREVKRALNV